VLFSLYHPLLINRAYAPLSAWVPLSGWDVYDGTDPRWMDREIKHMMSANFDIVFHSVQAEGSDPKFGADGDNRTLNQAPRNFFSTYRKLIDQGYVPPQISVWVNHEGFGGGRYIAAYGQKLDLSTPGGRDYYYTMLNAYFWRQYFEIMGLYADQYLATKNGKVMVSLDALINEYPDIAGLSNAFLDDLNAQFTAEFGYEMYAMAHPSFGYSGPHLPAIDETHNAFGPSENFYQGGLGRATGKQTVELLPGFFIPDQDFRTVLRSGGIAYEAAWQKALALKGYVSDHLAVTAWNYIPHATISTLLLNTPRSGTMCLHMMRSS
jgi:hypothetical protein